MYIYFVKIYRVNRARGTENVWNNYVRDFGLKVVFFWLSKMIHFIFVLAVLGVKI